MPADPADEPAELLVAEPSRLYARQPLVVDCSVLAAVLFDEPERDAAAAALTGRELCAPALIDHELVSVAVKKARAGLPGALLEQGLADLAELELTRCRVAVSGQWRLALEHELSAYDAAYLWLAAELRAPLATYDRRLGEAARRASASHR